MVWKHIREPKEINASHLRNLIFGVEDGLVSTVGLLSGIAIAEVPRETILITGIVLIFVEAFSMAVGSFLSEHYAEDYLEGTETPYSLSFADSVIMFCSYLAAGLIPLLPYIIFEKIYALTASIMLSLVALFSLGVYSANISKMRVLKSGFRMLIIGGMAIAVGVVIGQLVRQ